MILYVQAASSVIKTIKPAAKQFSKPIHQSGAVHPVSLIWIGTYNAQAVKAASPD
jgi:hypothetical protein